MSWLTFLISFIGGAFTLLSQFLLLSFYKNVSPPCLFLVFLPLYIFHLLILVYLSIVGFRAVWSLLDLYYFPEQTELSQVTGLAIGLVLLTLLRMTSCLHAGVTFDYPRSVWVSPSQLSHHCISGPASS